MHEHGECSMHEHSKDREAALGIHLCVTFVDKEERLEQGIRFQK